MIDRFVQAKKDGTLAKYTFKLICCHSTTTTLIPTTKKDKTKVGLGLSNHQETSHHHPIELEKWHNFDIRTKRTQMFRTRIRMFVEPYDFPYQTHMK